MKPRAFTMESNQKNTRYFSPKKRNDREDYDRFEHKASSYKRREKYQSWKSQEDDLDDYIDDQDSE